MKCKSILISWLQDEWQNGRALVLLKLKELTMRATQAEQRVHELEQLLRDHALVGLDDTWGDSEMVTSASTYNCLNKVHDPYQ